MPLGSEIINVKKCNEKEISEGCFFTQSSTIIPSIKSFLFVIKCAIIQDQLLLMIINYYFFANLSTNCV